MKFVSADEVEALISFPDLIAALKAAFAESSITAPLRHHHAYANPVAGTDSTLLLMPAWSPGNSVGIKLVTVSPHNNRLELPSIQGVYALFDATSGTPRLLLDARALTTMRTAAASALASEFLSRKDSTALLMIGTGALAPQLIRAHATVRPIDTVYVWGRDREKAERLTEKFASESFRVLPAESIKDTIAKVDIVSCATLSSEPLVLGRDLRDGQHVDLVGSFLPAMREADDAAVRRCSVFVDHYAGAVAETGDIVQPLRAGVIVEADLKAELAELCRGEQPGRTDDDEVTLFKSVGHALEDLAAAILIEEQIGTHGTGRAK